MAKPKQQKEASWCYHPEMDCPSAPKAWPWDDAWWKPTTDRGNLIKAGALILAEIERLDRAEAEEAASYDRHKHRNRNGENIIPLYKLAR